MAVTSIHRRFGPRSLVKGKPRATFDTPTHPHIPTGFSALDDALGIGGLPKGRITEIAGLATSGKTTLALKCLVQAQAAGGQVGYIDQAGFFDPDYAYRCGIDLSHLLVGTPEDLDETLAMVEALVRNGGLSALICDATESFGIGLRSASRFSSVLSRLSAPLKRTGTTLLFLHDLSTTGTMTLYALSQYATVRLQVVRERWKRLHGDIRGYEARVEVLKNRLGPVGCEVTISIDFNGTVHGNGL
jgi:recombination protein RecA